MPNVTRLVADFESRSPLPVQQPQLSIGLSLPRPTSALRNPEPPHSYTRPAAVSNSLQMTMTHSLHRPGSQSQLKAHERATPHVGSTMSQTTLGQSQHKVAETATVLSQGVGVSSQRPTGSGNFVERDPFQIVTPSKTTLQGPQSSSSQVQLYPSSSASKMFLNPGPIPQRSMATPIMQENRIGGTVAAELHASASVVRKASDELRKAPSLVVQDAVQSMGRPARPVDSKSSPNLLVENGKLHDPSGSRSRPVIPSRQEPSKPEAQSSSGRVEEHAVPQILVTAPHTPPKPIQDYRTMPEPRSTGTYGSSLRVDLVTSGIAVIQSQPKIVDRPNSRDNHIAPSPSRTPFRPVSPTLDPNQGNGGPDRDIGTYSTLPTLSQIPFRHPQLSELLASPPGNPSSSTQGPRDEDDTYRSYVPVESNQVVTRPTVSAFTNTQTTTRPTAHLRSTGQMHVPPSNTSSIPNLPLSVPSITLKNASIPISHSASRNTQSVDIPPVNSTPYASSVKASDPQFPTRPKESIYPQHMPTQPTNSHDPYPSLQSYANDTASPLPQLSLPPLHPSTAPVVPMVKPTTLNSSSHSQTPQPMATSRTYESARSTIVANSPWILPPTSNVVLPQYAEPSRFGSAADNALQSSQINPVSFRSSPPVSHSAPYHSSPRRQPTVSLPSSTVPPSEIPPPSSSRTLDYASRRPAATSYNSHSQTIHVSRSGHQSDIAPSRSPHRLLRKASSESLLKTPSSLAPSVLRPTTSRTSNPEPSQSESRKTNLFQIFRSKPKASYEVWHPPESSKNTEQDMSRRSGNRKLNDNYDSRPKGKISQSTPAPIPTPSSSHHKSHGRNFNPFGSHLTPSSKPRRDRDRTMSAVSAEAVDGTAVSAIYLNFDPTHSSNSSFSTAQHGRRLTDNI